MNKKVSKWLTLALTCNIDNTVARKLYENKGFSVTGVEDENEIELVLTIQ